MEALNTLVSESLARHGFDRPPDYRRLQWSRWFRCESHHSLLFVPSKPGVFAIAEEIVPAGADSAAPPRRMLAVTQFFEDDDMAFVLDRMLSYQNPMRARLNSGRYFVRFVVIESHAQRRSLCAALNQWIVNSTEKATGIGSHFASSLEFTEPITTQMPADYGATTASRAVLNQGEAPQAQSTENTVSPETTPQTNSGAATNIHCPFPSGF
jgi:hypothetical protein